MTSLTGSAGEDFASILRALGYRMERRPARPPKPAVEAPPAPADTGSGEISSPEAISSAPGPAEPMAVEPAAAVENGEIADFSDAVPPSGEAVVVPTPALLPDVAFAPLVAAASAAPETAPRESSEPVSLAETAVASAATDADAARPEPAAAESATEAASAVPPADAPPAVPEMVEVWRPGGRSDERRPRHDRGRHRHQGRQERSQDEAPPPTVTGEGGDGEKRERYGRGRRHRSSDFRKSRGDAPVEAATGGGDGAAADEPRSDQGRPPRPHFEGKSRERDRDNGKYGGGRDKGGRDRSVRDKRPDGGPSHRQYASSAAPRDRDRAVDPNSPFAKLAALKEQLAANRKDQH
jgi:ATP-dependent RNA helicase SUPV3L1/SUV3